MNSVILKQIEENLLNSDGSINIWINRRGTNDNDSSLTSVT